MENETVALNASSGLIANFSNVSPGDLIFEISEYPQNGTIDLYSNGAFIYTPDFGFNGPDDFIVQVFADDADPFYYQVIFDVTAINHAPVSVVDTVSTNWLTDVDIDVLSNDSDLDSDTLSIDSFDASSQLGATLTQTTDGKINYDPAGLPNWTNLSVGSSILDQFSYTISDPDGLTSTSTVNVSVTRTNQSPVATADEVEIDGCTAVIINVLANDTDADANDYFNIVSQTSWVSDEGVTVSLRPDHTFCYDPASIWSAITPGSTLNDEFTYQIQDSYGSIATGTVSIEISRPQQIAPIYYTPINDTASVTIGQTVSIDVLDNDSISTGLSPSILIYSVSGGTAVVNNHSTPNDFSDDTIDFTAGSNHGKYSLNYKLVYNQEESDPATIQLSIIGSSQEPLLLDDHFTVAEDTSLSIVDTDLLGNDWTPTGMPLSITNVSCNASSGTVQTTSTGWTFTPKTNFNGSTYFTYTATNGSYSRTAYAYIDVTPVNDAPVATDKSYSIALGKMLSFDLLSGVGDIDGDSIQLQSVDTTGMLGTLSPSTNPKQPFRYTYSPGSAFSTLTPGQSAQTSFDYTVIDPSGQTNTGTITITVSCPAPKIRIVSSTLASSITSNASVSHIYDSSFPVQRTYTIYNSGNDTLELDLDNCIPTNPSENFEIIQMPAETIEPGYSTALTFTFNGAANDSIVYTIGTNDPLNPTFIISHQESASTTERIEVSEIQIGGANGYCGQRVNGYSSDYYDVGNLPLLTGTLNKSFSGDYTSVQFDMDNDDSVIEEEEEILQTGDAFSVDLSEYFSSSSSLQSLRYRTVKTIDNTTDYGNWITYSFFLDPDPSTGTIRVENLALTSVAADNTIRINPYITGSVLGNFDNQNVSIQFAHTSNASTPLATISITNSGNKFFYDPYYYDSNFTIPVSGSATIYYRLIIDNAAQSWQSWVAAYPNISSYVNTSFQNNYFGSYNNVYYYGSPISTVSISGSFDNNCDYALVRWDFDNDGSIDQTSDHLRDKNSTFYPEGLPYNKTLQMRGVSYVWAQEQRLWVPGTQYDPSSFVLTPAWIGSITSSVTSSDEPIRYKITGTLSDCVYENKAFIRIAFDKDNDGLADGYTYTDEEGNFSFTPENWSIGTYSVRAAVCVDDVTSVGAYAWSSSTSYSFELQANIPTVDSFELSEEIVLPVPYLEGQLAEPYSGTVEFDNCVVEFDENNDNVADIRVSVDEEGAFQYIASATASSGNVNYRVGVYNIHANDYIFDYWNTKYYSYTAPSLTVTDLVLANAPANAYSSEDPTIKGQITGNKSVAYKTIELDFDYDGTADGTVIAESDGSFVYTPDDLTLNQYYNVRARVLDWNYQTGELVAGEWSNSLSFSYSGHEAPSMNSFNLQYDTGYDYYETSILEFYGSVYHTHNYQSYYDGVYVEFYTLDSQDNSETILGETEVDSSGNYVWSADAKGFTIGEQVTIYARAKEYNDYQQTWLTSYSNSMSITYDPDDDNLATMSSPPNWTFSETDINSLPTTAFPYINGQISDDGDKALVEVEFRIAASGNANPIPLGCAQVDTDGYYSFYVDGLASGENTLEYRIIEHNWADGSQKRTGNWQSWSVYYNASANSTIQIIPGSLDVYNHTDEERMFDDMDKPYIFGQIQTEMVSFDYTDATIEYRQSGSSDNIGTVSSDALGSFCIEYANPSTGTNTLEFRPYYYSDTTQTNVYGAWQTLSFTWEAATNSLDTTSLTPVFGIQSLALYSDSGSSDSDYITDNAQITVQTFNSMTTGSLMIELDSDCDGEADQTSYAYGSSPSTLYLSSYSGPNTVYIRTSWSSGVTGSETYYSDWLPFSFVYYSSYGDLSESDAIDQYSDWIEESAAASTAIVSAQNSSATTLKNGTSNANVQYLRDCITLNRTYYTQSLIGASTFNSAYETSQSTYDTAISTAQSNLTSALNQFQGVTTAFDFTDFAWDEITVDYEFEFPVETDEMPEFPDMTYAGPEITMDGTYIAAIQTADTTFQQSKQSANSVLKTTLDSLNSALTSAQQSAYGVYNSAVQTAESEKQSYINSEMAALKQTLQYEQTESTYKSEKERIENEYNQDYDDLCQEYYDRQNQLPYAETPSQIKSRSLKYAEIYKEFTLKSAQLVYNYNVALENLEKNHNDFLDRYTYENQLIYTQANLNFEKARNEAQCTLNKSLTQAQATFDIGASSAQKTYNIAIATAQGIRLEMQAIRAKEAVNRFYNQSSGPRSSTSPQAIYEIDRAAAQKEYATALKSAYNTLTNSVETAQHNQRVADIQKHSLNATGTTIVVEGQTQTVSGTHDYLLDYMNALTDAKHQHQKDYINAELSKALSMNEYNRNVEVWTFDDEYTMQCYWAERDYTFSVQSTNAYYRTSITDTSTEYASAVRYNSNEYADLYCQYELEYDKEIIQRYRQPHVPQDSFFDKLEYEKTQYTIQRDYELAKNLSDRNYNNALVLAEKDFNLGKNTLIASSSVAYTDTSSQCQISIVSANYTCQDSLIDAEDTLTASLRTATKNYQISTATAWLSTVETWNNSINSDWGNYQYALAEATVDWITNTQTDSLAYNLSVDAVNKTYRKADNLAQNNYLISAINAKTDYDAGKINAEKEYNIQYETDKYSYLIAKNQALYLYDSDTDRAYCQYQVQSQSDYIQYYQEYHQGEIEYAEIYLPYQKELSKWNAQCQYLRAVQNYPTFPAEPENRNPEADAAFSAWSRTAYSNQQLNSYLNTYNNHTDYGFELYSETLATTNALYARAYSLKSAGITYADATQTAGNSYADACKTLDIAYQTALASADKTLTYALAEAEYNQTTGLFSSESTIQNEKLNNDIAFEQATSLAQKTYELAIYLDNKNDTATNAVNNPSDINTLKAQLLQKPNITGK